MLAGGRGEVLPNRSSFANGLGRSSGTPGVGTKRGTGRLPQPARDVSMDQKTILSANCQLLPEGETTLVIVPKAELVGVVFGFPKLVWFQAL